MCSQKGLIAFGFSNGTLKILEVDSQTVVYHDRSIGRNGKAIEQMSINNWGPNQNSVLFCLSNGMIHYYLIRETNPVLTF